MKVEEEKKIPHNICGMRWETGLCNVCDFYFLVTTGVVEYVGPMGLSPTIFAGLITKIHKNQACYRFTKVCI